MRFVLGWVQAWLHKQSDSTLAPYAEEAAARLLVDTRLRWQPRELNLQFSVEKLLSSHSTIQQGNLSIRLDEFLLRQQRKI